MTQMAVVNSANHSWRQETERKKTDMPTEYSCKVYCMEDYRICTTSFEPKNSRILQKTRQTQAELEGCCHERPQMGEGGRTAIIWAVPF